MTCRKKTALYQQFLSISLQFWATCFYIAVPRLPIFLCCCRRQKKHKTVCVAVLDFTKAFNWVPRVSLMKKLTESAELDKCLLHWIEDFLGNRTQQWVVLQGHASDSLPVFQARHKDRFGTSTLPYLYQWLTWLFWLFMSLVCWWCICLPGNRLIGWLQEVQQNSDSLSAWSDKRGMLFNIFKSKIISFNSVGDTPRYI